MPFAAVVVGVDETVEMAVECSSCARAVVPRAVVYVGVVEAIEMTVVRGVVAGGLI